jgi:mono/diheme cytochrome c family protein
VKCLPPSIVLCALLAAPAAGQDTSALAAQAQAVFAKHCLRCHGNAEADYFDVRVLATLKRKGEGNDKPYITPGKPDDSLIWEFIKDKASAMPKSGEERKTFGDEQRKIIKDWILAGAPDFPHEKPRNAITLEKMLQAIWNHASNANQRELPYLRYFTLSHLHNNSKHYTADDLRLTRAAVAKAINSLSWAQQIVLPEDVPGADGTVLVVNISKLGWTREMWNAIAKAYPYGLGFANHDNDKLKDLDDKLRKLFSNREELIHLRADWFVATATRPPLYHQLLFDLFIDALRKRPDDPKQPDNPKRMKALDLETHLGVNVIANLLAKSPEVMRAGFPSSGVSGQNRLIERHPLRGQGAYWKSYDFKSSTWEANLQQFPLGPRFQGNPFEKLAFKHDGGEIIFHLPNGLQGYLLINGKDERIDEGPITVVSDSANTSGTPVVVNGISCMACHKNGMRPSPADQVRTGKGVFGEARERVKALYPEKKILDGAIDRDAQLFQAALERTIGPLLRFDDETKKKPLTELAEPVGETAKKYYAAKDDLDAVTLAAELYLDSPKALVDKAGSSDVLRELGLGALAVEGGKIKRGAWESIRGTSQMQQAAREFGYSPR